MDNFLLKIASLLDTAADNIEKHLTNEALKKANIDVESDSVKHLISQADFSAVKLASQLIASQNGASIGENTIKPPSRAEIYAQYDNEMLNRGN